MNETSKPGKEQLVHFGSKAAPLLIAAWLGLMTGYLEVLQWFMQRLWGDPFSYLSRDMVWMAPLADLVVFSLLGILFSLLAYLLPDRTCLQWSLSTCMIFGYLSLLFLSHALHPFASILLAVGLGYQTSLLLERRLGWVLQLMRKSFAGMIFLVLALLGASQGWKRMELQSADDVTALSRPHSPNVILVVMDTVRAQSLSLYGYQKSTSPNLERLAKTGILFENALSTSPWTLPSHASIFTGEYPHRLSAGWYAPLDNSFPTLAEILTRRGYRTSGFVANTTYCSWETGLDRGFTHFEDYTVSVAETFRSCSLVRRTAMQFFGLRRMIGAYDLLARKTAEEVNRSFLAWLERGVDQPFFSFLNYFDSHDPYLPPGEFAKFGPQTIEEFSLVCHWWASDKNNLSQQQVTKALRAYEGSIRYIDKQIGELLKALKSRGLLENTIIIVTSDHGELFGEHGLFGHGNCLYRPVLQVPLLISYPSVLPIGARVIAPVSLREIPATVMELIGEQQSRPFPGSSLSRYWQSVGKEEGDSAFLLSEITSPSRIPPDNGRSPVSEGPMKALVLGGKQYIKNYGSGVEELYDFFSDPGEVSDLAQAAEFQDELQQSRRALAHLLSH